MQAVDIDTGDRKQQRKFGLVMAVAFAVLGVVRSWLAGEARPWLFVVSAAFLVLGLAAPRVLRPILVAWLKLSELLNWVMTRVLLTLAFFGLITPTRAVMRLLGNDPMRRAWEPAADTYWEEAEEQPEGLDRYRNQF
ncbi:MAG: hypothetical protein JXR94_06795 [Candidatus Hydrogenedentes bacterium]|nr:hypothetical protein [Candidatus Hydrogenedentota bacterium]